MSVKDSLTARFGDTLDVPEEAEALQDMAGRGVCRSYQDRPVDPALIHTLCGVALSSPSKSDLQQRDIVVVTDPAIRRELDDIAGFDWQPAAHVLLIFCANHQRMHVCHQMAGIEMVNNHLDGFFNAAVDAGIALSAFVTAAERIGLGTCPLSVLRNQVQRVSDLLELPERVIPVAGLTVGWPARSARISPRLSLGATVHQNRFSPEMETGVREYNARRGTPPRQRETERFGEKSDYGWSDDKARQYADPQREDFGEFVRSKGFGLD